MPEDPRIFSSDEHHVPHSAPTLPNCDVATESLSTTKKIMNKADEKRVFITLIIAILIFVGTQLLNARDSTNQQPLVDGHQDFQIQQNARNIDKMDGKLDKILARLPQ